MYRRCSGGGWEWGRKVGVVEEVGRGLSRVTDGCAVVEGG